MRKTFLYRIYPSHKQVNKLEQTLDGCRWFYNHLLEQRKNAWEIEKKSLSRYGQSNCLKTLKQEQSFLLVYQIIYVQFSLLIQDVCPHRHL